MFISPIFRLTTLATVACGLAMTTGCSVRSMPDSATRSAAPWGGAPLSAEDHAVLSARGSEETQHAQFWPLPLVSRKYMVESAGEPGTLAVSDYSMIGLGIPYFYLPLQFSFSRYNYGDGGGEPTGRVKRRYWPWYSYASTKGEVDGEVEAELFGIPLLFEYGRESGPTWYFDDLTYGTETRQSFSFWSALWWVGPVYFDSITTGTREDGTPYEVEAEYFFPLFLGRAPGAVVWFSYDQTESDRAVVRREIAHGPLLGYAGWYQSEITEGEGKGERLKLLLGGLLWYDGASGEPGTTERRRTTGPLWGVVGTTIRDGRRGISLLRLN